jgi:A/G-specific adenine glycosylase
MKKTSQPELEKKFAALLLKWNREKNNRQMPWKGENDPYKIWLSEIILQQTRVEQGLNYYNNFIKTFPDINKLAKAYDEKIFKMWEGLGYYTRCRNLIATARFISKEHKGEFPVTYDEIKALKGVGPYTAAAISSFAFNLPHAVVDGNVFRVLARVFGINKPVDTTEGKKYFASLADKLLDKKQPGLYNQAIMDFGAVVCKPLAPLCPVCPFKKACFAFLNNKVNELPVKKKKINIRKRWFYFLVLEYQNTIAIRRRMDKDIWQDLYEFPLIEKFKECNSKIILQEAEKKKWILKKGYEVLSVSPLFRQQLSHQLIAGQFIKLSVKKKLLLSKAWVWVTKSKMLKYAFPQFINQYLKEKARRQSLF